MVYFNGSPLESELCCSAVACQLPAAEEILGRQGGNALASGSFCFYQSKGSC